MGSIIYEGQKYNWDGKYYSPVGGCIDGRVRLHVAVWQKHNGKVQRGFHVHHKDHDRTNNEIGNLKLLSRKEHLSKHALYNLIKPDFVERQIKHLASIRPLTKKWHKSKEGSRWHKKHGIDGWKHRKQTKKKCEVCRKDYQTPFPFRSKYCHNNCKAKALRLRRRLQS